MELLNDLEVALVRTRDGLRTVEELLGELLQSRLSLLVTQGETGHSLPLLLHAKRERMAICFTDVRRVGEFVSTSSQCIPIRGIELVRSLPPDIGLAVNPGTSLAFEISADCVSLLSSAPALEEGRYGDRTQLWMNAGGAVR